MVMAQDRGQPSFAESQKANAQMLRQYTWRSRTEIKLKGESKNVKLEQVRYDANGTLEKTPIGAPAAAAPQAQGNRGGRGGRLKAKVIENKKEEFGELMQGLGQLVASYGHLPPDRLEAFKATATTGRGEGALQGTAQIQGVNVLEQGDSMTIWIDPASKDDAAGRDQDNVRQEAGDAGRGLPECPEWANLHGARGAHVSGKERGTDRRQLRLRTGAAVTAERMRSQ